MRIIHALGLLLLVCGAPAWAAGESSSQLEFTGQVHRGTCQLSPASTEQFVRLARMPRGMFKGRGSLVADTPFQLTLRDCDGLVQAIHFEFQPENNVRLQGQLQWFANVATLLPAYGAGVALFTDDGRNVLNADGSSDVRFAPTADQTYGFHARYVQTANQVTAGFVRARVVVYVRYD